MPTIQLAKPSSSLLHAPVLGGQPQIPVNVQEDISLLQKFDGVSIPTLGLRDPVVPNNLSKLDIGIVIDHSVRAFLNDTSIQIPLPYSVLFTQRFSRAAVIAGNDPYSRVKIALIAKKIAANVLGTDSAIDSALSGEIAAVAQTIGLSPEDLSEFIVSSANAYQAKLTTQASETLGLFLRTREVIFENSTSTYFNPRSITFSDIESARAAVVSAYSMLMDRTPISVIAATVGAIVSASPTLSSVREILRVNKHFSLPMTPTSIGTFLQMT